MRWIVVAAACLLPAGVVAWGLSDRVEQDNDFCNSCHLSGETPLHIEVRNDFDRTIPVSLAGVHGRGWVEEREDSAFRCIDCHAGSGVLERTRVKLLSARDGLRYIAAAFEEPHGMSFELSPPTCLACHPTFRRSAAPGWTVEAYHGLAAHDDAADAPRCVACHTVHETDGDAIAYYMARPRVDQQCRGCHVEGGEMEIPSLVPSEPGSETPR
ncbi:MAG: hypothetical protein QF570_21800 [Myxococcota bacterium]|jgi:hypothetical protein|nr:hypothetical protein [Myxococcota bacterium]